jgi:FKBP-type peptidyl-prolyl cis-trans isomerase
MEICVNKESMHHAWMVSLVALLIILLSIASMTSISTLRQNTDLLIQISWQIKDIRILMKRYSSLEKKTSSPGTVTSARKRSVITATPEETGLDYRNESQALSVHDRRPNQLQPQYEFDYGEYLNRLEGKQLAWTRDRMLAFFEDNARQEGVTGLPEGVQYKVLKQGDGRFPEVTDTVIFDFRVFLPDGTEIYSSFDQPESSTFRLDEVVPGLKLALPHMRTGAQWEVYMPPALAFPVPARKLGRDRFEPLIYVVELKSVIDPGKDSEH